MSGSVGKDSAMRVIIYGAGAVGGNVGGRLANAGESVILIGREGQVNAIREDGLQLVTPTGTLTVRLPAVTTPKEIEFGPEDVVWLCMKGHNTEEALRDLHAETQDVPIFCFQNGVRNEEIASRYFPRVYGVALHVGSIFLTNGEVKARRDPPGSFVMGRYPTGRDDLVEGAAAMARAAGYAVFVTSDIMPYKWGGMLTDLRHVVSAITNVQVDVGDNGRISEAVLNEAEEVVRQAGIPWVTREELRSEWPEDALPPRSTLDSEALNSMWQSLARQLGTVESDFLNGEIVRLAERLGRQAPVNEALMRISQDMAARRELPGKYAPDELSRLVGLG